MKEIVNNNLYDRSYFLKLEVENVVCFKDKQVLDLSDGNGNFSKWTVILGDNGTGKTTLLKILDRMQCNINHEEDFVSGKPLLNLSNNLFKTDNALITLFFSSNEFFKKRNISKDLYIACHNSYNGECQGHEGYGLGMNIFLLSYGASRRMNKKGILSTRENDKYKWTSLFDETIELINVEEWFLEKFLKSKIAEGAIKLKVENQLELVKNLLVEILPDVKSIRIKSLESVNSKIVVEVNTTFGWVNIRDLSYGYQTITSLIVDIAANMMENYPESENPLSEPAIILIDEIDLHLHPKWQRTLIDKLSFHFPKAQFIVTAHSPLIVQAAEDRNANIVVCRKEEDRVIIDNNPDNVKGWRVDQILTSDLFDVESPRSQYTQEIVDEYMILKGKQYLTKKEKDKLEELSPNVEKAYQNITSEIDEKLTKFAEKYLK
jgi:predicted ATP-binding protein involved in virulence